MPEIKYTQSSILFVVNDVTVTVKTKHPPLDTPVLFSVSIEGSEDFEISELKKPEIKLYPIDLEAENGS